MDEANIYYKNCQFNKSRSENERRECLKYNIPLSHFQCLISLPPELDKEPFPNLGPKVNHHFSLNNSAYGEIEHPRWGVIIGVGTQKPIKAGEEIFTHYSFKKKGFPADYPWYFEAQKKYLEEENLKQECYSSECSNDKTTTN